MQFDKEKQGISQGGLLEKYVLGLCNASEQKEAETLIKSNPAIGNQVGQMKKAVKCYCTSCHSNKIKSIQSAKNQSAQNIGLNRNTKVDALVDSNNSKGFSGKILTHLQRLFTIKL